MKLLIMFLILIIMPLLPNKVFPIIGLFLFIYITIKKYTIPKSLILSALILSFLTFIVSRDIMLITYPFATLFLGYLMFIDTNEEDKKRFFLLFFPNEAYIVWRISMKSIKRNIEKIIICQKARGVFKPIYVIINIINLIFKEGKSIALTLYARLPRHNQ